MACAYSSLLQQIRDWTATACDDGYLQSTQVPALPLDQPTTSLFGHSNQEQPLRVAFLGGTGVGKSALLNRLVGAPLAQSGIERPTSKVVTLYHHASLKLEQLPEHLPLDSVQIGLHHQETQRHTVWLDMPDFDSIANYNQQLVLQWLPHIDILIYVVSPERYRDRKTWQLLQSEGAKHAWLFVMNQWDKARQEQFADLRQQLQSAGFEQPMLFKTSCTEPEGDDFPELVQQIQQLSGQLQRMQLQQHLQQQRFNELAVWLETLKHQLQNRQFAAWSQAVTALWQKTEIGLQQGLDWPVQQSATQLAETLGPLPNLQLWDAWAQSRLEDVLDDMAVSADAYGIPVKMTRQALHTLRNQAEKTIHHACQLAVRKAFSQPGNRLQRILLFVTAVAETLLPLTAMGIVGYQVFVGYYQSTMQSQAYLGTEFAVHSVLLIAVSWLLPFFLHRKLQPSRLSIARTGLQTGLLQGLEQIKTEIDQVLQDLQHYHQQQATQIDHWLTTCQQVQGQSPADTQWQRLLNQNGSSTAS